MFQNHQSPTNLDPEIIKAVIQQQNQKLQLEASRLKLEEKRLEQNSRLSEQSMLINMELLKNSPAEHRKTIALYCLFIFSLVLILLGFILFCLNNGKDEFINKFLNWLSHIIGIAAGYLVGRNTAKKKHTENNSPPIPEAEEIG